MRPRSVSKSSPARLSYEPAWARRGVRTRVSAIPSNAWWTTSTGCTASCSPRKASAPTTGSAAVGAAEEREGRAEEDLEVDLGRAVPDVPDVELDPLRPRQRRASVHLRPAREPRADVEPVPLVLVVLLDLVAQRRPRPDDAHVAAQDVPELRQLVDRRPPQDPPDAGDAAVSVVHRIAGAHALRTDDHGAQLEHVEVGAVLPDAGLPVEDRAAVLELDRERRETEKRAREHEPSTGDGEVRGAVQRVPFALSQVCGVPERR